MPTYRLHDHAGCDLRLLEHPAPGFGHGSQSGYLPVSASPSRRDDRTRKPAVPEGATSAVASPEDAPAGLDWQAFSAACFPGSRRHNLKAIVAYGAYKRSLGAGEQQPSEAARLKADAISTEAQAVDEWEDEGGASR